MLHTKFQVHRPKDVESVFRWQPSWSCDINHLHSLSFFHPVKAPHEIWLQSAKCFLRKRSLKMLKLSDLGHRSMNDLDL